ncbi:hypothetical protein ACKI1Q_44035, partial [Streptomyces galilaeus]|uniref:hypothetical protein n=1 Tax=Streptomyces galilaeus TaxID=33899 RepID=UPI0038F79DF0
DFVINIPNSHFWALSGSITGQLKDGEVVAFQSQVGVEGTTPVEPYLDNDTVMALLDNVLIH